MPLVLAFASSALLPGLRCSRCVATRSRPAVLQTSAVLDAPARTNPLSDRFELKGFHHVEIYCADAASAAGRFAHALSMDVLARSGPATGNQGFCSVVVGSGSIRLVFTAPLASDEGPPATDVDTAESLASILGFDAVFARTFMQRHGGLAVRAVGVCVANVSAAFDACVSGGGTAVLPPRALPAPLDECVTAEDGSVGEVAEVQLYGDVVLRLLSLRDDFPGAHLPGYESEGAGDVGCGLCMFDHVVGNVWSMGPTVERLKAMTGMHEFAEFTSEDVGTIDSGLNSIVLASNNERVLLPINEPTYGTPRRSQIQTYLEQHGGEGVQHIALYTTDIFNTVDAMRAAARRGGFELMNPPSAGYYAELPARIGDGLEEWQLREAERVGVLVDRDDQGVLLQVFTKPVGDRPTLFLEIIQRVGCMDDDPLRPHEQLQRGGCGGFGKGNFKELFKSVEDYERQLSLE